MVGKHGASTSQMLGPELTELPAGLIPPYHGGLLSNYSKGAIIAETNLLRKNRSNQALNMPASNLSEHGKQQYNFAFVT